MTEKPTDPNKRKFLLGMFGAGAIATGALSNVASDGVKWVFNAVDDYVQPISEVDALMTLSMGRPLEVSMGSGNLQGTQQGKPARPSVYIEHATTSFVSGFCEAFKNTSMISLCKTPEQKDYSNLSDTLFLGGPLANETLAKILGYRFALKGNRKGTHKTIIPKASKNFKLRFEQLHGDDELGVFSGTKMTAQRFDQGKVVERAMFAIKDHKSGNILHCEKDGEWLSTEFLQIIRIFDNIGRMRLFIFGLHGHSLQGFTDRSHGAFQTNLQELSSRIEGRRDFQLLLPMRLERRNAVDGPFMQAIAQWDRAIVESLSF